MNKITTVEEALIAFNNVFIKADGKIWFTSTRNASDNVEITSDACIGIANVLLQYTDMLSGLRDANLRLTNDYDNVLGKNIKQLKVIKALKKLMKALLEDL